MNQLPMEVTIERILPGGFGLAHAEGKTVMVSLAAPGDRVRVRVDREKGNVCFASIVEVIEPSVLRVEPPCPYFGSCGGCDFQQMSYQAQLAAKAEIIKDCLHRIAKLESVPDFQITPAPNQWRYRSRAQWQYDAERKRLGYFETASRRVCDVAECAVLVPELQRELDQLRQRMTDGSLPDSARYFRAVAGDEGAVVSDGVGNSSEGSIRRTIHAETYALDAESFFQTNLDLLPELINAAIGKASGNTAIEFYCGVGLFTLPLARRFSHVIAVEENADAVAFARGNLANAGLMNAEVVAANVGQWLGSNLECGGRAKRRRRSGFSPRPDASKPATRYQSQNPIQSAVKAGALQIDLLLLDPPRVGAESRVIDGILQLLPRRICYVSCDPATLARDLRKIIAGGYSLDTLAAFDMFPQTHHVETIANLTAP
jgi:tRNA/tmRNA/rRNA uracil-C5-methylase (TrmA/RlmC/RlmD family)